MPDKRDTVGCLHGDGFGFISEQTVFRLLQFGDEISGVFTAAEFFLGFCHLFGRERVIAHERHAKQRFGRKVGRCRNRSGNTRGNSRGKQCMFYGFFQQAHSLLQIWD